MRTWLVELRQSAGKKQHEIATAAEITQPSYSEIEQGRKTPRVKTAKKIAAALGFPWQKFYEEV